MKSLVTRDKKRRKLFKDYEQQRLALKVLQRVISNKINLSKLNNLKDTESKENINLNLNKQIQQGLNVLDNNSSKTRIRNRCVITGRGRSVWSAFRLSRIQLRKLALKGDLMGVRISSW